MTLVSKVNWKSKKIPKNFYKGLFFTDQVYIIRKPEVFSGWVCEVLDVRAFEDKYTLEVKTDTYPKCFASDGEFSFCFDGLNHKFEIEYLGKL